MFVKTHFLHGARLLPDSHDAPDGDLQAADKSHTHPEAFAPRGVLIRTVSQGRSVHLDENVGQDKLHGVKMQNTDMQVINTMNRKAQRSNVTGRLNYLTQADVGLLKPCLFLLWVRRTEPLHACFGLIGLNYTFKIFLNVILNIFFFYFH